MDMPTPKARASEAIEMPNGNDESAKNGNVSTETKANKTESDVRRYESTSQGFSETKASKIEIEVLTEYETTSQGILEAVGLQQTLNIAVVFVKADLVVNFVYYMTSAIIVTSIVAQAVLAILVGAKIWTRRSIKRLKTLRKGKLAMMANNGGTIDDKILMKQNRLRLLDSMSLFLTISITFLTAVLLASSGMVESRTFNVEGTRDISPTGASVN